MAVLRFIDAIPCNSLVETLDIQFVYLVNQWTDLHCIRIIGGPIRRKTNLEQKQQATQYLFAAALYVIETEWNAKRKLPNQDCPYWERTHFPKMGLTPLEWKEHVLSLVD